ncbi:MAG TPA: hypothetical protein VJQ82_08930 [Terriglobales bacterium]|nr:hypothetical protein [Terriglobales bacterium]
MPFDREQIEARLAMELIASTDMTKIAWDALDIRDYVTSTLKNFIAS